MDINTLSGIEFEDLTHQLLLKIGFSVEQTKASRDGGIDLIAYSDAPFFKGKYIIQCKRYTGTVGEPIIRDLYGVVSNERANKGILITTGNFSNSALEFAKDKNLELIDGINLESLLMQYLPDINANSRYFMDDPKFDKDNYLFLKKKFINEYKNFSQKLKKYKESSKRGENNEHFFIGEIEAQLISGKDPLTIELFSILRKASVNKQWLLNGLLEELLEIENIIPYYLDIMVGKGASAKKLHFLVPYWIYILKQKHIQNPLLNSKKEMPVDIYASEHQTDIERDFENGPDSCSDSNVYDEIPDELFNEPLLYALNNKFLYCIQELKDIRYVVQILYYTGLYTNFDKKILDKYCQTDMLNDWLSVKDIEPHVKVDNLDEIVQDLNWFIKNNEL